MSDTNELRMRIAAIAAECSDPETTDALDKLLEETPAAPTALADTNELRARLLAHAEVHDACTSEHSDEQAQWARDLREAAGLITAPTAPAAGPQQGNVPDGYMLVMVPEIQPQDEPDWDECIRQAEVATGLKVERNTLSIVIREVRRWLAGRSAGPQQSTEAWIAETMAGPPPDHPAREAGPQQGEAVRECPHAWAPAGIVGGRRVEWCRDCDALRWVVLTEDELRSAPAVERGVTADWSLLVQKACDLHGSCDVVLAADLRRLTSCVALPATGAAQGDGAQERAIAVAQAFCRGHDDGWKACADHMVAQQEAPAAQPLTAEQQDALAWLKSEAEKEDYFGRKNTSRLLNCAANLIETFTATAQQEAPAAQPLTEWRNEDEMPPEGANWYEIERADGTRCARAWGNDCWWVPLQDGWFSGIPAGFRWRGPLSPVEVAGDMSPLIECGEVERAHGIQPAATKGTT